MTHASLFSGIGSFDLAFECLGVPTIWQCEQEDFCTDVLNKHWPNVQVYPDVRELYTEDGPCPERPDILTGGFPCQDISLAGEGAGLDGEKSRLWWEAYRITRLVRPRYLVLENVPALTGRGLPAILGALSEIGMMRNGRLYRRQRVVPRTLENESSLWPTLTVSGNYNRREYNAKSGDGLTIALFRNRELLPTPLYENTRSSRPRDAERANKGETGESGAWLRKKLQDEVAYRIGVEGHGYRLNPSFVGWMMGFPRGWCETGSEPTETASSSP